MKLIPVTGFVVYKGATISSAYDASGALYWVCTGRFADDRFGTTVFKQVGEHPSTIVFELPIFCNGRGTISPDGRITAWSEINGVAHTFVIPGFQPIAAGVVVPVTLPGTQTSTNTDVTARASAAQALVEAKKATTRATEALAQAVSALTIAMAKPSIDQVWQKILDGIDGSIADAEKDSSRHLARFVWQKALDAAYSLLKDRGIITK